MGGFSLKTTPFVLFPEAKGFQEGLRTLGGSGVDGSDSRLR